MSSSSRYLRQRKNDKPAAEKKSCPVNVEVAVRCRPLNEREKASSDTLLVKCHSTRREIILISPAGRIMPCGLKGGKKIPTTMYSDPPPRKMMHIKASSNPSLMKCSKAPIAHYSRKTHTIEGQRDANVSKRRFPDNAGMIPRAVKQIFDYLRSLTYEHAVKVSLLELYNEQFTDLLGHEDSGKVLRMYEDKTKGVFVNGLDEFPVKSEEEIYKFLERAASKRNTAETLMKKFSSSSHSVFSITIHIKESSADGSEHLKVGKLNLVDLAGSVNVDRSGPVNKRAREAGNINRSLLTLERVINALVEKHPHIPYRNSKLMILLQDSLGGGNKTCIIATATCASSPYEETGSTLAYASNAKNIKNHPTLNQKTAKDVFLKDVTLKTQNCNANSTMLGRRTVFTFPLIDTKSLPKNWLLCKNEPDQIKRNAAS